MTPTHFSIIAICIAVMGFGYNVLKSPKEEHQRVVERSKTFVQQVRRFFVRALNLLPYVASIGLFVWYGAKVANSSAYTGTDVLMLVVGAFLTLMMAGLLAIIRFGRMMNGRIIDAKIEALQFTADTVAELTKAFQSPDKRAVRQSQLLDPFDPYGLPPRESKGWDGIREPD